MIKNLFILFVIFIFIYKDLRSRNWITASILSILFAWVIIVTFTSLLNGLSFSVQVLIVVTLLFSAIVAYTYESER
ncbi:hypothetical protein BK704_01745 [[Bacillus thuringiensis] serovar konkukian]|nr:hypothetical protein [Bacillus thuringiensis]MED1304752.1 hypothetical protein [Bacillus pacificus]OUB17424.1 hypothetical protein BK704_01745 [[Bacillus thuringiensis] serovar konkukian]